MGALNAQSATTTPQITMGFPVIRKALPNASRCRRKRRSPRGHPEDFKPEQPGVNERAELAMTSRLWGAVGGNQARFADQRSGLGAGDAKAGSFEIRPCLLRAILANRADIEPITLGEGLGYAGFDRGAKPGKMVSAVAISAAKAIAESALIMTVPCHGPFGPSFRWMDVYPAQVSGRLRRLAKMVSSGPSFVSSPREGRNITGSPGRRFDPGTGSSADPK